MASEEPIYIGNVHKVTQDEVLDDDDHNKDRISDVSSRYSDNEDKTMFEPDLDYEPEEDGVDDLEQEGMNETPVELHSKDPKENLERKSRTDRSKLSYLSSDDDDDIEVIDVINIETVSPEDAKSKEDRKENNRVKKVEAGTEKDLEKRVSRSRSSRSRDRSRYRSQERNSSITRKSIKRDKSSERNIKRSSNQEIKENKYSREDVDKLKAYFARAQDKRKFSESRRNETPAKKFKGNNGRGWIDSKEDWLKEKLEREGKVFIRNYIPFPSSQKSNFKRDIQIAFKDELNVDKLTTLTPSNCGLCFKDFDDEVVAWKHYTGSNHKGTIKRFNRGTYKGHPPFWRMVHDRLCDKDPGALTEREIFDQVCDNYNVGDNRDKVKSLVKRNIDCLIQHDQVGIRDNAYFIKNKNVQEVRKIFENYFYEMKRKEKQDSYGVNAPTRRNYEESSSSRPRRSYEYDPRSMSRARYPEDRRILPLRHSSSSRYIEGNERNPANQMLVVDPSKLRTLPNGQIMIKQDDVMSRPRELV